VTAVILVEGQSDKVAIETLALRRGRDLAADDVDVVAIGGAQAIGRVLAGLDGRRVAGLCDAGEELGFRRAFERAGIRPAVHVCDPDLEGELIRALGAEAVEGVLGANGDLSSFRTMQKQPVWRGRPVEDQLRRFLASGARRKVRYAALLVDALELPHVPAPLDGVLADI
jgi:Overcoming lysogenization defect protein-like, TOPRIM domain